MAEPGAAVCRDVDKIIAFVVDPSNEDHDTPRQRGDTAYESSLGHKFTKLGRRCVGSIGCHKHPSDMKLTPSEVEYFRRIEVEQNRVRGLIDSPEASGREVVAATSLTPSVPASSSANAKRQRTTDADEEWISPSTKNGTIEGKIQMLLAKRDFAGAAAVQEEANRRAAKTQTAQPAPEDAFG